MRIDSSGNVGIGTTSPTRPFEVETTGAIPARLTHTDGSGCYLEFGDSSSSTRIGSTGGEFQIYVDGDANYAGEFEAMRIDSSGNVGIGTSSPSYKLHCNTGNINDIATFKSEDNIARIYIADNDSSSALSVSNDGGGGALVFETGGDGDNAGQSERMRIDSSGRVGIGTSSPDTILHLKSSSNIIKFEDTDTDNYAQITANNSGALLFDADEGNGGVSPLIAFSVSTSEAMRIDSSGNLLVGKTNTGTTNAGHSINSIGIAYHTRDGGNTLVLNRLTSDGDLVQFRKDGTTVGSISSRSGSQLIIEGEGAGINLFDAAVRPTLSGDVSDGTQNLGTSGVRWQDLYLSGGVYLGGTGSANKIEDYEEGTWTPEVADGTGGGANIGSASTAGYYTKIGRVVHLNFALININTSGMTAGGSLFIRDLPFTSKSNATLSSLPSGSVYANFLNLDASEINIVFDIPDGQSYGSFRTMQDSATAGNILVSDIASGSTDLRIAVTYTV